MLGTIIVSAILVIVVALVIRKMIRDKKKGINPLCGCDCGQCSGGCKKVNKDGNTNKS